MGKATGSAATENNHKRVKSNFEIQPENSTYLLHQSEYLGYTEGNMGWERLKHNSDSQR